MENQKRKRLSLSWLEIRWNLLAFVVDWVKVRIVKLKDYCEIVFTENISGHGLYSIILILHWMRNNRLYIGQSSTDSHSYSSPSFFEHPQTYLSLTFFSAISQL